MKAVVKYGQGPKMVEIRDVPKPEVIPDSVLVAVKATGVCGWDIEMWQHRMANPVTVPVIQGHEFCGIIEEVGEGVDDWCVADRVVCETSAVICGKCRWCRAGDYQVCPDRKGFGYGVNGAFASHVVVRQEILHRIPKSLSFEEAALTEPFCVVHHALTDQVRILPGDVVCIIGPGPIGLISLQVAKIQGASRTILVGVEGDKKRMDVALAEGWADRVVCVNRENPIEVIMQITDGMGVDVVADCAGNSEALYTGLKCVRRCGQVVKIGWDPEPFNRSLDILIRKSLKLVGTFGHNWQNWEAVLRLLEAGRLQAKPLISEVIPISEWEVAFQRIENRQAIKIVLYPDNI